MSKRIKKIGIFVSVLVIAFSLINPIGVMANTTPSEAESQIDTRITLDPSYQHKPFEGWGTALVWFANITGGWPDDIRNALADELFGEEGLNLNIARYNIGGQDSPETEPYMRLGGAVPGYWNRPAEFGPPEDAGDDWEEPEDWWDPENPEHWDWDKDANQQWWLEAAKNRGANTFEAFSNSPPYFMTNSGYTSGNFNSWDDNLQSDKYEEFAIYLTSVIEHLQKEKGIDFQTISPVNEPNTGYWGALGRQEGSNWSPASQAKIINEVSAKLNELDLDTVVSAMDETNPQKFRQNWEQYSDTTKENVGQMNVHTYWPSERNAVRDIAKGENKKLWMSEVDLGPSGVPQDFDNIEPGLALSERITSDITNLESQAWVLWQAIEDQVNMNADNENMNWGLIHVDFEPENFDELEWHKNKKYYTMANYTKFIRPGYQVINTDNKDTLAAIDSSNNQTVVVYTNHSEAERDIAIDLSKFGVIDQSATATPYVTSAQDNLVKGKEIAVNNKQIVTSAPAKSVTTFVVSNVAGINDEEALLSGNKTFSIENKNSKKVLELKDGKLVQYSADRGKSAQEWEIHKVTDGFTSTESYQIVNRETNDVLTHSDGTVVGTDNNNSASQRWIISTSGKGEFTFINEESRTMLEVGGQSKNEGASVGVWKANAGDNQVWEIKEAGIAAIDPITTWTNIGSAPILPSAVTVHYGDGETAEVIVEWDEIDADQYKGEGEFIVEGSVAGTDIKAQATVYVSEIVKVIDEKVKTTIGQAPLLPNKIKAELATGQTITVAVEWNNIDPTLYADFGQFSIQGRVVGTSLIATANVQVVKSALENIALNDNGEEFPKASASFTGEWDNVNHINDGDYSDKRWTNWDPNEWREKDWVEINFGKERTITDVHFTFYDDIGGTRPPESLYLEYWDGTEWKMIEGTDVDISQEDEIEISFETIVTSKVRAQLTAMPDTCSAIVEMEVYGYGDQPIMGNDASLHSILIDGVPLAQFASDQFNYEIKLEKETSIPDVKVELVDVFATYEIELPSSLPGQVKIIVTSEDQEKVNTYTIDVLLSDKEDEGTPDEEVPDQDKPETPDSDDNGNNDDSEDMDEEVPDQDKPGTPDSDDNGNNDGDTENKDENYEVQVSSIDDPQFFDVEKGKTYVVKGTKTSIRMPSDLPDGTRLAIHEKSLDGTNHQGLQLAGDSFIFNFDFDEGATQPTDKYLLSMGYSDEVMNDKDIYYYNEENKKWIAQSANLNEDHQTLSIEVSHFSSYAVLTTIDEVVDEDEQSIGFLPNTATNIFNLFIIGGLLLLVGAGFFVFREKLINFKSPN